MRHVSTLLEILLQLRRPLPSHGEDLVSTLLEILHHGEIRDKRHGEYRHEFQPFLRFYNFECLTD